MNIFICIICVNVSENITDLKSKCIAISLRFSTLSSWIAFCESYLAGTIQRAFNPLQEELKTQPGLEYVELEVVIYADDFLRSTKDIGNECLWSGIL